jgi:MFS family permease
VRQPAELHTFRSLRLRDFRLLWLGQLTTSMGQWMDQAARGWLIYTLTGSAMQLGLVSFMRGAPLLFFGVVAGVVADRYGRKAQLIIAQVVNAILNLVLATLILTHRIQVWHVYVTGFLAGTVQAFQQPARQVLINDLVGREHLMNAIALNSAAFNLSRSVGPAVCGVLIQAFGVDVSYYVQAAFYAFATLWTGQMRVPPRAFRPSRGAALSGRWIFGSAGEGFRYILSHRLILALMTLALAPILLGMPYTTLMPVFALGVLKGGATTQGLLLTMVGAGAVCGALTVASLGKRQGSGKLLVLAAAAFGLSLVLFSRSQVLWLSMVFAMFAGFSNASYTSQDQTMMQMLTPDGLRGRVMGTYMLNRGLMPVGSLLAGALATAFGGPWAVTIMGASCVLLAAGVGAAVPELWRIKAVSEDGTTES